MTLYGASNNAEEVPGKEQLSARQQSNKPRSRTHEGHTLEPDDPSITAAVDVRTHGWHYRACLVRGLHVM